jgi:hypothetical protein
MLFPGSQAADATLSNAPPPPAGVKFVLLHDTPNVEGIRNFFTDVHELVIKVGIEGEGGRSTFGRVSHHPRSLILHP